ncbi:glycine cleavage system protein GcvH [bacterium]|nr:glycine cleavage system protein GcvH [bacterium]
MQKFTQDHEWIKVDGAQGFIGITDYAQKELGDVVFIDLPSVGTKVTKGKSFANVESVKAVSDIYAPASGTITEVNTALADRPELINQSAETDGWLVKIAIDSNAELEGLMDRAKYDAYIAEVSK